MVPTLSSLSKLIIIHGQKEQKKRGRKANEKEETKQTRKEIITNSWGNTALSLTCSLWCGDRPLLMHLPYNYLVTRDHQYPRRTGFSRFWYLSLREDFGCWFERYNQRQDLAPIQFPCHPAAWSLCVVCELPLQWALQALGVSLPTASS